MADSYTTFGNYLLLKQRSQDGLGTLWRGGEMERAGFKRIVWLRRFDQVGLDRTALNAEANLTNQVAQAFKATNVARNATFGSEGGVPYLAWDYVPAQPLDQLLVRVGQEQFPVAIDNALLIIEKLAAALSAALAIEVQGEALYHGFLVPNLVLVGNDGEAIVAGFGLARGLLANLDRVAVQQMASPYLAPEVLASARASRRADVYSLGAILYHLLCGQPLPADAGAREAALAEMDLAGEEGPVPADVGTIVRKALSARPEDRYASALEFKRELEKLLYGGAYSPTTFNLALFMDRLYRHEIEQEDRDLQRERGIDVTPYYRSKQAAPVEEAPPSPPAPASRTWIYVALGGIGVLLVVILYLVLRRPTTPVQQSVDPNVLKQLVAEELAKINKQQEDAKAELEKEKLKSAELQHQIEKIQKGATSGKQKMSAADQQALEQKKKEFEAQQAEQKRREEEVARLARLKAETEAAATKRLVARVPVPTQAPAAAPTAGPLLSLQQPTQPPRPQVQQPAVAPTQAPVVAPTQAPAEPTPVAAAPPGPAGEVKEGDLVDPSQVDVQPHVLIDVKPTLPRAAQMVRTGSGVVIMQVLVNEKGTVDNVKVLRGFPAAGLGIDEACTDAVKQYRFRPGTKDGKKIKTYYTATISVNLEKRR